jgi:phage-related minor tail protein
MGKNNIKGINLEIGGSTTKFNQVLKDMSSATRATQKELDAVNKSLKFDPKNVDLLKQKEELLAKQIEDVRTKVEKMKTAKAKADAEMANGTEVNQEQYRILVREISAAEGHLKNLEGQAKKTGKEFDFLGKNADKINGFMKNAAIGAVGLGGGLIAMGVNAAKSADDINTLARQTGLSTDEIQKFQYASENIDVSLETLTGSMAKLTKNMQTAKNGSKNTQLAFNELGVSITDNEGKLRSNQDVFNEAIDALAKMENETQRDALAMQIFGKSAQDLNPLILGGSQALEELGKQAEDAGFILSEDTLNAANELNDAIDTMKATATGAFAKVGSEIATELTPMIEPAANAKI